jgi:type VI secretion system protein VasD
MVKSTGASWLFTVAATVLMAGCGSAPEKPADVKARISASADVNPNSEGRPSPVHVRIFQLKEDGAFMSADFWSLVDKEQEILGDSLVQRLEEDLAPGEQKEFELKIAPEARVLAVMAEFADYRNAQWRVIAQTPNKSLLDMVKKDRVSIQIEKNRAIIVVGD